MSRIFFATWHGSYQMIKRASSFIDSRIDLSIFSGKELEDGWTSLEECLDKIEEADLVVYYVTQSFSMWGDILEKAKEIEGRKCPKCGATTNQIRARHTE